MADSTWGFDFVNYMLAIRLSDGRRQAVPLAAKPVAEVDGETLSALASNHPSRASPTR
ncbi:MAG TPA: hypothetical protein VGP27_21560 [Mycobacterium sp.]|jgi:hypothetical protein|nr:hypothetical protein [Mycobacterium sp.]